MPANISKMELEIKVGETSYAEIDIKNLRVDGCTEPKNPTNFFFSDGIHRYKYTSADCQLLMSFDNSSIVKESWKVRYAQDAFELLKGITCNLYSDSNTLREAQPSMQQKPQITESYSWLMWNRHGEVEPYSGFNNFFGVGSKISLSNREGVIRRLESNFSGRIDKTQLEIVIEGLRRYLLDKADNQGEKRAKELLREHLRKTVTGYNNVEFKEAVLKLLYRPMNEMYIPIPNSREFHNQHPSFFGPGYGTFQDGTAKLAKPPENRVFNLIFEPSGDSISSFITQDCGKGIESWEKQSYLGEWILRGVFQLKEPERSDESDDSK